MSNLEKQAFDVNNHLENGDYLKICEYIRASQSGKDGAKVIKGFCDIFEPITRGNSLKNPVYKNVPREKFIRA